jgi:hypothetical protein
MNVVPGPAWRSVRRFVQVAPWQRSTLYANTPTLSVEAAHARLNGAGPARRGGKARRAVGGGVSGPAARWWRWQPASSRSGLPAASLPAPGTDMWCRGRATVSLNVVPVGWRICASSCRLRPGSVRPCTRVPQHYRWRPTTRGDGAGPARRGGKARRGGRSGCVRPSSSSSCGGGGHRRVAAQIAGGIVRSHAVAIRGGRGQPVLLNVVPIEVAIWA